MKKNKNKTERYRLIIQVSVFILVFGLVVIGYLNEEGIVVLPIAGSSVHNICPFGGIETLYNLIVHGTYIQKVHSAAVIILLLTVLSTLLFGRVFCGFVCPFGTIQELFGKLGKKIFGKNYNHFIPKKLDYYLSYLKYVLLALILFQTYTTGKLIFQDVDPYYAMMSFFTSEVSIAAYVILGFILLLSLMVERPFCRYGCPLGASLSLVSMLSIFKVRRNSQTCISCKKCDRVCPMGIDISKANAVSSKDCIMCMKCVSESVCPIEGCLTHSTIALNKEGVEVREA